METEQWTEAQRQYSELLALNPSQSKNCKSYLAYAIAVTQVFLYKNVEANKTLGFFDKEYLDTISWPRAKILQSDQIANGPDRFTILETIFKKYSDSEAGWIALQRLGMNQMGFRDLDSAQKTFELLKLKTPPASQYNEAAAKFLAAIDFERNENKYFSKSHHGLCGVFGSNFTCMGCRSC